MTTEDKRRLMNDFILQVRACDSRILDAFRNEDSTTATSEQHYRSGLLLGAEIAGIGDEVRGSAISWTDSRIKGLLLIEEVEELENPFAGTFRLKVNNSLKSLTK